MFYVGIGAAFVAFSAVIAALGARTGDEARPTRSADLAVAIGVLVLAVSQIGGFAVELVRDSEATITHIMVTTMLIAAAMTGAAAGLAERRRRTPRAPATSPDPAGSPDTAGSAEPGADAAAAD